MELSKSTSAATVLSADHSPVMKEYRASPVTAVPSFSRVNTMSPRRSSFASLASMLPLRLTGSKPAPAWYSPSMNT